MDGIQMKSMYSSGDHPRLMKPVVSCLPIPKKVSLISAAVLHRRRTLSEGYAHERRMNKSCLVGQDLLASAQYNGSPIYGSPFLFHLFNQSFNLILFLVSHAIHSYKELWAGG